MDNKTLSNDMNVDATLLPTMQSSSIQSKEENTVVIPKETVLRLLKDIRNVMTSTTLSLTNITQTNY